MNSATARRARKSMVVAIADVNGAVCGAGFLVAADLVCTCTHVVRRALNPHGGCAPAQPGATTVSVVLEYLGRLARTATVLSATERGEGDIAILRLHTPAPRTAARARWAPPAEGQRFATVGFPPGSPEGAWVHGYISGQRTDGSMQLNSTDLTGYTVQPGFSGAPVWLADSDAVLGMICEHHVHAATATLSLTFAGTMAMTMPTNVATMVNAERLRAHLIAQVGEEVNALWVESDPVQILTGGLAELPGNRRDSVQQFLHQYLGTPAMPAPFGGRHAEMADLDRWLDDPNRPFAVMAATAGQGKSALVTRWAAQLARSETTDVIVVPISIRFDTAVAPAAISILGARLRHLDTEPTTDMPTDADTWVTEISEALRRDRPPDRRLIVIIDGADEAADWAVGQDLKFVDVGTGVKILLVARDTGERDSHGWAKAMRWTGATHLGLGPLTDEHVYQAVQSMGPALAPVAADPDILAELSRLCDRDPLLVGLWLTTLFERSQQGQPPLTARDLHRIPPGLPGLFDDWCAQQHAQWRAGGADPDLIEKQVSGFLQLCALALGPLAFDDAAELGADQWSSTELRQISRYSARFLTGDGTKRGWVFSHPRLAEFFGSSPRMNRDEHARWECRFLALGRHTLAQLTAGALVSHQRPYALHYYGAHLTRAAAHAATLGLDPDTVGLARFTELITPPWCEAIVTVTGTYEGFLAELDRAGARADQCVNAAVQANDTTAAGQILAEQVRLALVRAAIHSITANVPGAVVVGLLNTAVFSPRQAMAFSRRMFPDERVKVLTAVLAAAPELTDDVLAISHQLAETPARLRLLAAVGTHDPTRRAMLAAEALAMFVRACPQRFTADAVHAILPLLDADQRAALADLITSLGHPEGRAHAWMALAAGVPSGQRHDLLSRAAHSATALPDGDTGCELLWRVAKLAADPDQRAQALALARTRVRAVRSGDRRLAHLVEIYDLSPPTMRSDVQRDILADIDAQHITAVSANLYLSRLVAAADPAQLDELADWVSAGNSPMLTHSDYNARALAPFLCRLAARLDQPRRGHIAAAALTALDKCSWQRLVVDEERAVAWMLAQLPGPEHAPWRPVVDKLSILGQLERALLDEDQSTQLDLDEVSALLCRVLTEPGGDLDRVLDYSTYLPASCLIGPLLAAADVTGHRYSWHALPRALPHLLKTALRDGNTLEAPTGADLIRLITHITGMSRFYAFARLATHLDAPALEQVRDLQMRIDDPTAQDRFLITLATHMDPAERARWSTRLLARLGLPVPGTEATGYHETAAALLPLLDAEQTTTFATAIAGDVAGGAHRGRQLCEALQRLCELGRADTALALLAGDEHRFLAEDLAIKVAALAATTARPDLDATVLDLVGEGPSRARRLLALPEPWRRGHRPILCTAVAHWRATTECDLSSRFDTEMLAAALPYLTDPGNHDTTLHTLLDALAAFTDPHDRVGALVNLLGEAPHAAHQREPVVALARRTFTDHHLDTFHRRRLLAALAPHLDPATLTELILTEFAGDFLLEPALTAYIDHLDADAVRRTYAAAATQARPSGGADDILRAPVAVMTKCLIRLTDLGLREEVLTLLQQPPADTFTIAQIVFDTIADHLEEQDLPLAKQLVNPPGGFRGHPMTTATLLLRQSDFTDAQGLFEQLAGPGPTYLSGRILPGLTQRLLARRPGSLYRPMGQLLGVCSRTSHRSLLQDLADLTPLLAHLGGTAALEATAHAVLDVGQWFA